MCFWLLWIIPFILCTIVLRLIPSDEKEEFTDTKGRRVIFIITIIPILNIVAFIGILVYVYEENINNVKEYIQNSVDNFLRWLYGK